MMMNSVSAIVLLFGLFMTAPAHAGTVNVTNGHGNWQSTACTPPKMSSKLSEDPEEAADDLNAQMILYNEYVAKSQEYMDCISKEAKSDAEASNQIIVKAASGVIKQTQEQVKNAMPSKKE